MIKKMIKKKTEPTFAALKKNLFYTPISTRHSTTLSNHSHKLEPKQNISKSFKKIQTSTSINTDITQSFTKISNECIKECKNNTTTNTTIIDSNNNNNLNLEESCFILGKCISTINNNITAVKQGHTHQHIGNTNHNTQLMFNKLNINESCFMSSSKDNKSKFSLIHNNDNINNEILFNDDKEFLNINDMKLTNHSQIKELIQHKLEVYHNKGKNNKCCYYKKEMNHLLSSQNLLLSSLSSAYIRKDKCLFRESTNSNSNSNSNNNIYNRNNISNGKVIKMSPSKNNYPLFNISKQQHKMNCSTKNINNNKLNVEKLNTSHSLPLTSTPQDIVNKIVNDLYKGIYEHLFNDIALFPGYLDRKYIKLNTLSKINLIFLSPFFEVLFKSDASINKETFLSICDIIYSKLSINEKKNFVMDNKLRK